MYAAMKLAPETIVGEICIARDINGHDGQIQCSVPVLLCELRESFATFAVKVLTANIAKKGRKVRQGTFAPLREVNHREAQTVFSY